MHEENAHQQSVTVDNGSVQMQEEVAQGIATPVPEAPRYDVPQTAVQQAPKFPVVKLLLIIFGPGALFVISFILQIINRFIFTSTAGGADVVHPAQLVINLITMGIGVISVIGIICMPVAVILLIVNYNSKKNR